MEWAHGMIRQSSLEMEFPADEECRDNAGVTRYWGLANDTTAALATFALLWVYLAVGQFFPLFFLLQYCFPRDPLLVGAGERSAVPLFIASLLQIHLVIKINAPNLHKMLHARRYLLLFCSTEWN